jgi:hypothetical protein
MSFVESIIKSVVNVVEDVVETVVGVVEDVADFVVEEIIEPVAKVVDTVVTAVIEDPVATIASVAATVTGNMWAVPLINGADTLAKGGNIGDVLKSAAVGYVAPKVGSYVSGAVTGATGNAVVGSVAGATASGVVKGKSLKDALISGAVPEIASASLDVVKNNIPNYDTISSPGADSAIEKGIAKYVESGGSVTEAALAATATNLGTVFKDNTKLDKNIADALAAGLVAGMQDPEAALSTFKASLVAVGEKDLSAKIDDYFFTPEEEPVEKTPITDTPAAAEKEMGAPVGSSTITTEGTDLSRTVDGPTDYSVSSEALSAVSTLSNKAQTLYDSISSGEKGLYEVYEKSLSNRRNRNPVARQAAEDAVNEYLYNNLSYDEIRAYESGKFNPITDPTSSVYNSKGMPESLIDDTDADNLEDLATTADTTTTFEEEIANLGISDADPIKIDSGFGGSKTVEVASLDPNEAFKLLAEAETDDLEDILSLYDDTKAGDFTEGLGLGDDTDTSFADEFMGTDSVANMEAAGADADTDVTSTGPTQNPRLGYESFDDALNSLPSYILDSNADGVIDISREDLEGLYRDPDAEYIDVPLLDNLRSNVSETVSGVLPEDIQSAKENLFALGYSVGDGMLGAIALTVEGGANAVEDLVNAVVDNEDQFEFKKEIGEDGLERNRLVSIIESGAEFLKDQISTDLLQRRRDALPAKGMTFGEALPGGEIARDRFVGTYEGVYYPNGRPYGTDKYATLLNASEEFGDTFVDMAMLATGPYIGIPATLITGYLEGQADAERQVISRLREAQEDGTLADNAGYQLMLADAGGDEEKAFKKYEESFLKYTALAGSVEGISDFIVAKTAITGIKTAADVLKLPQNLQKALGIPASVTAAGLTGGLTEAAQTAIVENALENAGHKIEFTETGGAYLQGFAGQGGAVAVSQTLSGLNSALKKKYEAGDVTPEQRTYIEQQIINPQGEFAGTATEVLTDTTETDTVDDTDADTLEDLDTTADETITEIKDAFVDLEATGEIPAGTVEKTAVEDAFTTLEATGEIPAGTTEDTTIEDVFADLEATGEIPADVTEDTTIEDVFTTLEETGVSPAEFARNENFNDIMSLNTQANPEFRAIFEAMTGNDATDETIANTPNDTWKSILTRAENNKTLDTSTVNNYKAQLDVTPADEFVGTGTDVTDVIENLEGETGDTPTGITGFTTAKGSTYELTSDSTTERTRAARDDTEESGLQPRSGKTVYMNENDKTTIGSIFQTEVPVEFVPDPTNNTAKLVHLDSYGPLNAGDDASETVNFSLTPEVGLYPVEIYDSNNSDIRNVHFGSEIVGLNTAEDAFVDLEATGEIPAGETTTETIEDVIENLESETADTPTGIVEDTVVEDVIENLESEIADTPTGIVEDTVVEDTVVDDTVVDDVQTPYVDTTVDTGTDVTPDDVVAILGGNTDAVTDTDINTVEEIVNIVKSEVDASTDTTTDPTTETTVTPLVSTVIPGDEEERRRRLKRRKEQQALLRQQEKTRKPNLAQIDYLFDISGRNIFATPEQEERYASSRAYVLPDINEMVGTGEEAQSTQDINQDNFLQLIAAADMNPDILNQETDQLGNLVDLFSVDESEKLGITSPYIRQTAESSDETTDRILQLYNRAKV